MKKYIIIYMLLVFANNLKAQDPDQLLLLEGMSNTPKEELVTATYKATRVINQHTIEVGGKRTLDFRIQHHFGPFNSGSYDFWGLDGGASIRLGLEYSYDGRLQVGIGRTSYEKQIDGFLKYRLLRQTKSGSMPLSMTLLAGSYYTNLQGPQTLIYGIDKYKNSSSRYSFAYQIMIARKFNEKLSLQLTPSFVHFNQVDKLTDKNDVYACGINGRYKLTRRMAVTYEYMARFNKYTVAKYYDSMGIGIDVETGGHVFQMFFTNSFGMTENQYIAHTSDDWFNKGFRLGFNVSRVFTL